MRSVSGRLDFIVYESEPTYEKTITDYKGSVSPERQRSLDYASPCSNCKQQTPFGKDRKKGNGGSDLRQSPLDRFAFDKK